MGAHLVYELLCDPLVTHVAVFSRKPNVNRHAGASYHSGDIRSRARIKELLEELKPRVIFHSASPGPFDDPPNLAAFRIVNIDGTANVLACATEAESVQALVFTSSLTAVLLDKNGECFDADEEAPIYEGPITKKDPYSQSKSVADKMVRQANNRLPPGKGGLRTGCIRIPGIYGEGDENFIATAMFMAKWGLSRFQLGDNKNLFAPVYVGNAVFGHVLLAKALVASATNSTSTTAVAAPKVDGEAFHVTDGISLPFWNFMWKLYAAAGSPQNEKTVWVVPTWLIYIVAAVAEWFYWVIFRGQRRPQILIRGKLGHACLTRTYSVEKARKLLGWYPRIGVDEAAERSVKFALKEAEAKAGGVKKA